MKDLGKIGMRRIAPERGSVIRSTVRKPVVAKISNAGSSHGMPWVCDPRSARVFIRFTRAFTLIELILVLALLIVTIALVTPLLSKFMAGRSLDSEVRRMVSLTQYGQSRAVSEGIPTVLWVNPTAGTYGLRQETGYAESDPKAVDLKVAGGLQLGVDKGKSKTPAAGKLVGIHFSPEGNSITAESVAGISVREAGRNPVWIVPSFNGLSYEVRN